MIDCIINFCRSVQSFLHTTVLPSRGDVKCVVSVLKRRLMIAYSILLLLIEMSEVTLNVVSSSIPGQKCIFIENVSVLLWSSTQSYLSQCSVFSFDFQTIKDSICSHQYALEANDWDISQNLWNVSHSLAHHTHAHTKCYQNWFDQTYINGIRAIYAL